MRVKQAISYSLLAVMASLYSGCFKITGVRESMLQRNLPVVEKPNTSKPMKSSWHIEDVNVEKIGEGLEKIVNDAKPKYVAFGELLTPEWLRARPVAYWFANYLLPIMARFGCKDLVVGYLNKDVSNSDISDALKKTDAVTQVHTELALFYADDIIEKCRQLGVRIHVGGYLPDDEEGGTLTIDNYYNYGRASHGVRHNDFFLDIIERIKKSSVDKMIELSYEKGRKVMWYGWAQHVDFDEKALHAANAAFKSDKIMYQQLHDNASFAKEFREEGFKDFMVVTIVPPDAIPHNGWLNRPIFRMCWDYKKRHTAQILHRTVDGRHDVIILLPYEGARSGKSMRDNVIRYEELGEDEELTPKFDSDYGDRNKD